MEKDSNLKLYRLYIYSRTNPKLWKISIDVSYLIVHGNSLTNMILTSNRFNPTLKQRNSSNVLYLQDLDSTVSL